MKLNIAPMIVTSVHLLPNLDEADGEHTNAFSLNGSVSFNEGSSSTAKLTADTKLVSYGNYEVSLIAEFIIRFERDVSEDEAEKIIDEARTESIVFPYISSYVSALVALSGYQRPLIPVVPLW
ncbi:TPA: hypothetical protein ACWXGY_005386 [Klebsiella pneumoniae]